MVIIVSGRWQTATGDAEAGGGGKAVVVDGEEVPGPFLEAHGAVEDRDGDAGQKSGRRVPKALEVWVVEIVADEEE